MGMEGPGRGAPTCPRGSGGARYRPPARRGQCSLCSAARSPVPPLPGQPPGGTRSLPPRVAAAPRGCHRSPPPVNPGPARPPLAGGYRGAAGSSGPGAPERRKQSPQPPGCAFPGVFLILGETPTGPGRKRRGEPGGNRSQGIAPRCRERSCGPVPRSQPRPGSGGGSGACGPRARPLRYRGCPAAPRCPPALSAPSGHPGRSPASPPPRSGTGGAPGRLWGAPCSARGGPHRPCPAPAARCCPGTSPF